MVELLIVLVCQIGRILLPGRLGVVDDAGLFFLHPFGLFLLAAVAVVHLVKLCLAVHPHALFAKADGDGHKAAVFSQQLQHLLLVQEFFAVVRYVQHNVSAALRVLLVIFHSELRVALAAPVDGGFILVRFGENLHFVGHHKGRVKAKAEVAYQVLLYVFVFVQEVRRTAEGNLVDILLHLLCSHAYTAVAHRQGFLLVVYGYLHRKVARLSLQLTA